jgi:hypothetical protein
MPEKNKPFVVTDRRKFNLQGELRPGAVISPDPEPAPAPEADTSSARMVPTPEAVPPPPAAAQPAPTEPQQMETAPADEAVQPPTSDEAARSHAAYSELTGRLDTMVRAGNPGMEPIPPVSFEQLTQSLYMSALMQLGLVGPEGEKPRVDILGARQTIDTLGLLSEKTKGNLSKTEDDFMQTVLFELRITFMQVMQTIARQSAATAPPSPPGAQPVR